MNLRYFLLGLVFAIPLSAQVRVINDGFPGANTSELDARLDDALHQFKPNYVVLFAGANDALNEKKFLPANETGGHLQAMIDRIKRSGAHVMMITVHDPDLVRLMTRHTSKAYGDTSPSQRLDQVNEQVRRIALLEHVPVVPFATVLQKAGGANAEFSADGVHLTAKGYGLLATTIRKELPKHIPANTTILCFGDSLTYGIGVRPPNSTAETPETYPAQLRALLQ